MSITFHFIQHNLKLHKLTAKYLNSKHSSTLCRVFNENLHKRAYIFVSRLSEC